uniref:AMOP domain-containing protein n=1 Tax=Amphimedon queenslandica TaxID=400682 RepID=A0A1X7UXG1_AMPQE
MASAAFFLLFLALLFPAISAGIPFSSQLESSETDEVILERYRREEVFESSASGETEPPEPPDENLNCTRSVSVLPFSLIAPSLDSIVRSCTNSTSQNSGSYNFTITSTSLSPFASFSGESSTIFADHFKIGEDYNLSIVSNCSSVSSSCSYSKVFISLSLSILNHTARLLPFGRSPLLDEELTDVDDEAGTVVAGGNKPIPVFDGRYKKIYISSNGLVSFTRPYINWQPIPFPYSQTLIPVLAPLWIDFDIQSLESSALFYNTYTSTGGQRDRNMLKVASERVRELSGVEFQGSWVLIATWSNVIPYISNNTQTSVTFQLVLVSDYTTTYSIYIYNNTSSLSSLTLNSVVGYTAADFINFQNVHYANPSTLDTTLGNTGTAVGQWLYDVSPSTITGSQSEESCLEWVRGQELLSSDWLRDVPLSCPCSLSQATSDWRFNFNNSSRNNCAIAVVTRSQHGLECCYDALGSLVVDTEASGSYHYYHSLFHPEQHLLSDSRPFEDCCVESNNCVLYYKYRPSSNCEGYQPPTPGFIWGDPHFETFDGSTFTFNGVGEYQLIQSSVHELNVQIRLQAYTDRNATVLTAVAIKSASSQLVQFELNSLGSFVLYIGNSEHRDIPRDGEYLVVTETGTYDNAHLSSANPAHINNVYILNSGDSMIVSTGSGAVLNIGKQEGFLYMGVELGPEFSGTTGGLLGSNDGVNNNDYLLRNESVLSYDLTEEQVYYNFGLEWQVSETQSIFHYHSQYTYELYNILTTPTFGLVLLENNPTLNTTAVTTCGTDYGCLYDISLTMDTNLGRTTRIIRQNNQKIRENLVNFPPVITGDRTITVTVGDTPTTVQYIGEDPNTNNETIIRIKGRLILHEL